MRTIINYIRSVFCNHKFIYEETYYTSGDINGPMGGRTGTKVSRTCKKCWWHKSYWKF